MRRHPGYNIHQFPLRPERPKAHSPGQGEPCEPTPWVFYIHHDLRPERPKAFSYTVCYSCLVVRLLPFQGGSKRKRNIPRVSLPMVACPGLRDAALSGRCWMWGHITPRVSLPMVACPGLSGAALSGRCWMRVHYTQGVAPYGRLPWAKRCCPYRALVDVGIHYTQGVAPCGRLPWAGRYCPFRALADE